jgi:hypothetical protein
MPQAAIGIAPIAHDRMSPARVQPCFNIRFDTLRQHKTLQKPPDQPAIDDRFVILNF